MKLVYVLIAPVALLDVKVALNLDFKKIAAKFLLMKEQMLFLKDAAMFHVYALWAE